MANTPEQQAIIAAVKSKSFHHQTMSVNAVSGSGKTTLLVELCKELNLSNGLYISYNAAIAKEASCKFPSNVICKTTHSLAYANTVRPYNLTVDTFNYRNIKDKVSYDIKLEISAFLSEFCLSDALTTEEFAKHRTVSTVVLKFVDKYLDLMQTSEIDVPHEFYLKFYHLLLANGVIEHDEFDVIMLDEAGDLNPVTLAIFNLLPAKKKVMVGDENQNIYSFNNTINGFELMRDKAISMSMTKSFRVSSTLAKPIERFCQEYMNPEMVFKGVDYSDTSIKTTAFISRTNSVLIGEMINLNKCGTPYNLVRSAHQIFKLPLMLINLKPKGFVSPEFRHLQEDINDYHENLVALRVDYPTQFSFLLAQHPNDINLKSAINLITKYSPKDIVSAYQYAKSHSHKNHNHTLCTAHSSKGLEFDEVKVGEDVNTVLDKLVDVAHEDRTNAQQEEFRLAYVLFTRAKKKIVNARHLHKFLTKA